MAFIVTDDVCTDPVRAHSSSGKSVTVTWGGTSVRLTIAEAVDLIDAVATVLGSLPEDAVSPVHPTRGSASKKLTRDEVRVRAEAEVREAL